MKYRNNKSGIIINYTFGITFFLLVFINVNAQRDCQNKLDEYNQRSIFPSEQLTQYENCLNNLNLIYTNLFSEKKTISSKIDKLKSDSNKNKESLNRARQIKDSLNIELYESKEIDLNNEISDSNSKLEKNKNEITSYKTTLKRSYEKIVAYYTSIEDPRARDWQKKLDALMASIGSLN